MIDNRKDGRWANDCALCRGERRIGVGIFRVDEEPECPWCRAVRLKHGSYWYPITVQNQHLLPPPLPKEPA